MTQGDLVMVKMVRKRAGMVAVFVGTAFVPALVEQEGQTRIPARPTGRSSDDG